MTEFAWFRSTATGKVGKYPEHFAGRPTFERIDSSEAQCVDCWVKAEDVNDEDELIDMETDTFGFSENVLDEDESEDN